MSSQDPGRPPVPSIREALLELVRPVWRSFCGLRPAVQGLLVAGLVLSFLLYSCGAGRGPVSGDRAAAPAGGASPSATTSTPASTSGLTVGRVPEESVDLDTELAAQDYSDWLTEFGALTVDEDSISDIDDDLDALAEDYGGVDDQDGLVTTIPGQGSRVRSGLKTAARQIRSGEKALKKAQYGRAQVSFQRATDALSDIRTPIKTDLLAVERDHGLRMTRSGAVEPDLTTDDAVVESWVDGDTVITDQGRIRVVGINTPELRQQCVPAQAAKDAVETLAPPGSRVRLVHPESVDDVDRYGRLLRYVDAAPNGTNGQSDLVDVGYSLLLSGLAEPRYDSRDGYQWHVREAAYRATNARPATGAACPAKDEQQAFAPAAVLAKTKGTDEYWRHQLVTDLIARPYRSAAKHLKKHVESVRRNDEQAARAEKAADEREQQARSRELARERQRQNASSSSSSDDSSDSSSSSGGGGYPGYTGRRCYAPGGKTWKPC